MNKKTIIKSSLIAIAIIALFFNTNDKVFANMQCTQVNEDNVKYVNSTIVDINPEQYNSMVRGISTSDYYSKNLDGRSIYDNKAMLFGYTQGKMISGIQNEFISIDVDRKARGVMQGLANSQLTNGNLVINNNYSNGTSFFPDSGETGSDKPYNEILSNWKFPFLKEKNGYYSFNSEKYHVSKDYNTKTFNLHEGERNGFFPFNNCQDNTFDDNAKNLYFTAKIDIPFIMNSDGKVKNCETGNYDDMIFNFSGDDDVWIYVDGNLVLDLGGAHIKQSGSINFAKNQVWYSTVSNLATDMDSYNVYRTAFAGGKLAQGKHNLKIFYMERAGGVSNLFASFNLQSSGVEVKHLDKYTNEQLAKDYFAGYIGENVETKRKMIGNYIFSKGPENPNITLTENLQTVYYYYCKASLVTTEYIDVADGKKISENQTMQHFEGKRYTTNAKDIKNYTLVANSGNTEGIMGHNDINVKYYYKYNSKLTANYVDKATGKLLKTEEKLGLEGDKVNTEEKKFDNYILVKKPKSNEITFTKKDQIVEYDYLHQSNVRVNYIDKSSNKNLDTVQEKVFEGSVYNTKEKNFENYKLVQKPENEIYVIKKDDIEVNYYFEKLKFNLKIDMNLEKALINENYYELNNKVDKVETEIREANNKSTAKIYYKIRVNNNQERIGSGIITDIIPSNYTAIQSDNPNWTILNGKLSLEVKDIAPNETREYELVLTKNDGVDVCGTISNKIRIDSEKIEETDLNDNEDNNDLVIIPRTGIKNIIYSGILVALSLIFIIIKIRKNKIK